MTTRIFHITLAVLVYLSSTGFVLNAHLCRGELRSLALFVHAEPCPNERNAEAPACPNHPPAKKQNDCCDDESRLLKVDTEQQFDVAVFDLVPVAAVLAAAPVYILPPAGNRLVHHLNYKPPLLYRDLPVTLQTFLC